MDDKFIPHHAYGGREHDAETPDPKCLLCQKAQFLPPDPDTVSQWDVFDWHEWARNVRLVEAISENDPRKSK
jgi:hypothetical protein